MTSASAGSTASAAGVPAAAWRAAGADGFGLGSNLYRAGKPAADVASDAARFVSALKDIA